MYGRKAFGFVLTKYGNFSSNETRVEWLVSEIPWRSHTSLSVNWWEFSLISQKSATRGRGKQGLISKKLFSFNQTVFDVSLTVPWISGTPAVLRYESTGQLYFRANIKRDKEASWKTSRGILQNTERRMQNTEWLWSLVNRVRKLSELSVRSVFPV